MVGRYGNSGGDRAGPSFFSKWVSAAGASERGLAARCVEDIYKYVYLYIYIYIYVCMHEDRICVPTLLSVTGPAPRITFLSVLWLPHTERQYETVSHARVKQ